MNVGDKARGLLLESFHTALAAADPLRVMPEHLLHGLPHVSGRILVVGAGKAAASMALAVETHLLRGTKNDPVLDGIVLTRYGHGLPLKKIKVVEAGHPLPDEHGEQATRAILEEVRKLRHEDFLLCLMSGGGSSLMSLPIDSVPIADLRKLTSELLRSGAEIHEINIVRKHLSKILGGRLAASSGAPVLALIISDVAGDDPTDIASGPCAPDPTTYSDALEILDRYEIKASYAVMETLQDGILGRLPETPKPGEPVLQHVENRVIATARDALMGAKEFVRNQGIPAVIMSDSVTGEAREVAKVMTAVAKEIHRYAQPWKPPVVLIAGGETTVTVKRNGRGGRNTEFLLSLAIELNGLEGVYALAGDTDGIDGTEDNAGALVTPDTLSRAKQLGLKPPTLLADNNSYEFFEKLGDLIVTGPTRTNVNDFRAILIG
ncbi:MAG TPA: glycerate kinase [Nitrosospira sp.]|nr:glycerate kinase [Nitrosospira sp.]